MILTERLFYDILEYDLISRVYLAGNEFERSGTENRQKLEQDGRYAKVYRYLYNGAELGGQGGNDSRGPGQVQVSHGPE